jgi:hypothetical protein
MKTTTAALCAVLLTLTACGGGDDDEAKKNIKANILEEGDGGVAAGTKPTEKEAECMADGMVDEVGVEKLQEYKLLDEDLKIIEDSDPTDMVKGDAESLAGVVVDCVDMTKLIQDQVDSGSGTKLTDDQRSCISDAIDEDTIKAGLAASFQGEDEDNPMAAMQGEMLKCVAPSGDGEMQMQ